MQNETLADDEISLIDIYEFLVEGWKTIVAVAVVGTSIGVITSLTLPEQFEAKASIESARLTGGEVVSNAVLAEKMRSPTYYDSKTRAVCIGEDREGTLEALAKSLNPNVAKNSNFVSVSYRAESREDAIRCLEQVLDVVIESQRNLVSARLSSVLSSLENLKKKADELRKTIKQLESDRGAQFKFKNIEYSAAALITVTLQSKVQELLATESAIVEIETQLKPPNTADAKFVTPIFASEQRVSPRRSLIVILSAMGSLFLGVLLLILRKVTTSIKEQREERQKSAAMKA